MQMKWGAVHGQLTYLLASHHTADQSDPKEITVKCFVSPRFVNMKGVFNQLACAPRLSGRPTGQNRRLFLPLVAPRQLRYW